MEAQMDSKNIFVITISLFALLWLIFEKIAQAVHYTVQIFSNAVLHVEGGLEALVPAWFWSAAVMAVIVAGIALLYVHVWGLKETLKNKSSVVETTSDNAFVFRNNEITAVSYRGIPPATKRIGHTSLLTPSESKILKSLEDSRIQKQLKNSTSLEEHKI
jgi:hypothetical protein